MAGPLISFLTDFGPESAPAVCRGVMWGIAPDARILDLTHNVRKFAVRDGAFLLSRMVGYLPVGVHVAVVDPGVGTARRPIAIRTARGDALVGPDNGLLMPAARVLGGVAVAYEITASELLLTTVSSTFHGRDIFSPVAAHLANGLAIEAVGPSVDPAALVDLRLPEARVGEGRLETAVLFIDSFGNARLTGQPADLARAAGRELVPGQDFRVLGGALPVGGLDVPWHATFGDVAAGQPLLYEDADYGGLGISVNQGSAAERNGLVIDTPVRIEAVGA
jgi:S-adenosyl-L-methionine hydrolase (adenosine-forming)